MKSSQTASLLIVTFLFMLLQVSSFPNGDLTAACDDMMPEHGNKKPNYSAPPFTLVVENLQRNNIYLVNEPLAGR